MLGRLSALLLATALCGSALGTLYPYASETREVASLHGIWRFRPSLPDAPNAGFKNGWFKTDLDGAMDMPVPSSFNDVTVDPALRDVEGWVWYQRRFYAPKGWRGQRVFLRFGSVQYVAQVYLNGNHLGRHTGGHLPFAFELTDHLSVENLLTVAVNNTLTRTTLPQGSIKRQNDTSRYPAGYSIYDHEYRYFNYAGIHRPVYLYTVPMTYVDDITVVTTIDGDTGIVDYKLSTDGPDNSPTCHVSLLDAENNVVAEASGFNASLVVPQANFWWPRLSHFQPAYLYTMQVHISSTAGTDVYRLPIGIRTASVTSDSLLLNGRPIYLRGVGRHEDSDVTGRGLDRAVSTRDERLLDWLGVNAFRTSHYPYAEETMQQADRQGYMVVVETPACAINFFSQRLLETHKRVLTEMIACHKNHPSVIMWSLANEPYSDNPKAENYFGVLVNLTKQLDSTRPVTFVTSRTPLTDKAAHLVDILCVNRYPGWYEDGGKVSLIKHQVEAELRQWHQLYNKSVIVTEYGAASVPGLHSLPSSMWTEEYHAELLREHFRAFDTLRRRPRPTDNVTHFLVGEMTWNFADFATQQEIIRPGFCMKGLFTRQRQPKMAAHVVRHRYWQLAQELDNLAVTPLFSL